MNKERETWIIQFDDQAMPNEVFTGEGARQAAGKRFNALSDNWTVTLFRSVPAVTQVCECPARKLDVSQYFGYDELPEDVKAIAEPPYSKHDLYGYLVIRWPDDSIQVETDHMEPEDAIFSRDLAWIAPALLKAAVSVTDQLQSECDSLRAELAASQERERVLREALERYAHADNWGRSRSDGPADLWLNCSDEAWGGPDLAVAALATTETKEKP